MCYQRASHTRPSGLTCTTTGLARRACVVAPSLCRSRDAPDRTHHPAPQLAAAACRDDRASSCRMTPSPPEAAALAASAAAFRAPRGSAPAATRRVPSPSRPTPASSISAAAGCGPGRPTRVLSAPTTVERPPRRPFVSFSFTSAGRSSVASASQLPSPAVKQRLGQGESNDWPGAAAPVEVQRPLLPFDAAPARRQLLHSLLQNAGVSARARL